MQPDAEAQLPAGVETARHPREQHHTDDGPDPVGRPAEPEPAGVGHQQGQHAVHGDGAAEEHHDAQDDAAVDEVAGAVQEALEQRRPVALRHPPGLRKTPRRNGQHQQPRQQIGGEGRGKHGRHACGDQQRARNARPGDARDIVRRAVQCHRMLQFGALRQFGARGRESGQDHGLAGSRQQRQGQQPRQPHRCSGLRGPGQPRTAERQPDQRPGEHTPPVQQVAQGAGRHHQQQHGQRDRHLHQRDRQRIAGRELLDEPRRRDVLHPDGADRDHRRNPGRAEDALAQRRPDLQGGGGFGQACIFSHGAAVWQRYMTGTAGSRRPLTK